MSHRARFRVYPEAPLRRPEFAEYAEYFETTTIMKKIRAQAGIVAAIDMHETVFG